MSHYVCKYLSMSYQVWMRSSGSLLIILGHSSEFPISKLILATPLYQQALGLGLELEVHLDFGLGLVNWNECAWSCINVVFDFWKKYLMSFTFSSFTIKGCVCVWVSESVTSFDHFWFKYPQSRQWHWYKYLNTPSQGSDTELNI